MANDLVITFKGDTSDALNKVGGLKGALGGLGDLAGGAVKVGLLGAVGDVAALAAGLGVAVKAAMDAEVGQAALGAVLESTKGKAGVTAEMANELASSLQNVTRFEDDTILATENLLLTFTNISKDVFPQTTEMALNLAQAMGGDTKGAAIQLGKALNDPAKGMTALTRVGVTFTDAQKKQIESLQASGDLMGAQKIILAELETEFGGAARAAGNTFAGKMDQLNHAFGDIQETIGGALLPILTELAGGFADLLSDPAIQQAIQDFATLLATGIKDGIAWLKANLPLLQANLKQTGETFGVIQTAIATVWNFVAPILQKLFAELSKFWTEIQPKLAAAWANIQKVTMQVFGAIVQFIQDHSEEIRMIFEGAWKIIQGIFQTAWALISGIVKVALDLLAGDFDAAGKDFGQMFDGIWKGIQQITEGLWEEIQGYLALAMSTIGEIISDKLAEIGGWFNNQFESILDFVSSLPERFAEAGRNLIDGLIQGFWDKVEDIEQALSDIIRNAINAALKRVGLPPLPALGGDNQSSAFMGNEALAQFGTAGTSNTNNSNVTIYATVRDNADIDRLVDLISDRLGTRAQHRIARGF